MNSSQGSVKGKLTNRDPHVYKDNIFISVAHEKTKSKEPIIQISKQLASLWE